jgi:hypothetical protein
MATRELAVAENNWIEGFGVDSFQLGLRELTKSSARAAVTSEPERGKLKNHPS